MVEIASIKRSNRRGITIRIDKQGNVNVYASYYESEENILRFVQSKEKWIEKHVNMVKASYAKYDTSNLKEGDTVYVLGVPYTLKIGDYKKAGIIGKEFVLPVNQAKDVEKSLKKWYMEVAKIHLSKVLEKELRGENVTLKLTSARGKWGSINIKGELRLNFRLIACPNYAIRYVCCHELCHLRQMNHSQNFYKLLDERFPDRKKAEKWLKDNAGLLNAF